MTKSQTPGPQLHNRRRQAVANTDESQRLDSASGMRIKSGRTPVSNADACGEWTLRVGPDETENTR